MYSQLPQKLVPLIEPLFDKYLNLPRTKLICQANGYHNARIELSSSCSDIIWAAIIQLMDDPEIMSFINKDRYLYRMDKTINRGLVSEWPEYKYKIVEETAEKMSKFIYEKFDENSTKS